MIFTSLSLLNRWGTPASANTTVTNYRAVKRRASHRAYTALTAYAPPFPHSIPNTNDNKFIKTSYK
jgi:hypothetical protein